MVGRVQTSKSPLPLPFRTSSSQRRVLSAASYHQVLLSCWSSDPSPRLSCDCHLTCVQKSDDEFVPFHHRGAFFGHIGPAVVALRTYVLEGVIMYAVTSAL